MMYDVNSHAAVNMSQPLHHMAVLDNGTGQNKSNCCFNYEAFLTTLGWLIKAPTSSPSPDTPKTMMI